MTWRSLGERAVVVAAEEELEALVVQAGVLRVFLPQVLDQEALLVSGLVSGVVVEVG